MVHQLLLHPAGQQCLHVSGVCPQIHGCQRGAYVGVLKKMCGCVSQRGNSGDGCDLSSTLCKYDVRKGD